MTELKIKKTLMMLFNIVFIITFGYITIDAMIRPSTLFASMNPLIILICAGILLFLMMKLNTYFEKLSHRTLLFITIGSFLLMFALQLFFIKFFKVTPLWDFGTVYVSALNAQDGFTQFDSYFYDCYPNNIPLFLFETGVLQLFKLLGITNDYTAFMLINIGFVQLALICLYVFIERRYGIARATLFSLFSLLITPLYSYSTIFYTDTLSMIFPILSLLLYDIFYHSKKNSKYIVLLLLAVVITLGTLMKMNVIILAVGIMIHYVMTQKGLKGIIPTVMIFGTLLLTNSSYHKAIEPYVPIEMDRMGYPMTHWVMMGLKDNGSYNGDDDAFTAFLKNEYHLAQEDITKEHLTVIKERLQAFGVRGFVTHLRNKLNFTWADGTYYAPDKLMRHPLQDNVFQNYVFGNQNQVFVYLSQISHVLMLSLILVGGISLFKKEGFESVMSITLFGIMLFLLIWETRSRYLVLFIPMMIALASHGFFELVQWTKDKTLK